MFRSIVYLILINISEISSQFVVTSLKRPYKDNPAPPASSYSQSMLNYYYSPYYHLALNDSDSIPDEQRLMGQLLRNYDPSARPVYNASNTVSVAFGISLTQLSDMVCEYKIV
jgi:hypothetical protein